QYRQDQTNTSFHVLSLISRILWLSMSGKWGKTFWKNLAAVVHHAVDRMRCLHWLLYIRYSRRTVSRLIAEITREGTRPNAEAFQDILCKCQLQF
ncbi:MAG: hypothetical protein K2N78_00375, partial [Oscillospiraceae bacterium]|nr:hypothetical protein [Oscillospiraceae bacterium]